MDTKIFSKSEVSTFSNQMLAAKLAVFAEICLAIWLFHALDGWALRILQFFQIIPQHGDMTLTYIEEIVSVSTAFVCLWVWVSQRFHGQGFSEIGLSRNARPNLRLLGIIFIGAFFFQLVHGIWLQTFLERLFHKPTTLPTVNGASELLQSIVLSLVGGGFREELFFRGYLLNRLMTLMQPQRGALALAVLLQIAFFGYQHSYQGPVGVICTSLGAAMFTWIYLRRRSVWDAVLFHGIYDVFGFLAIYLHMG
jgi:membrane protease YdiL (CAAX protease family)